MKVVPFYHGDSCQCREDVGKLRFPAGGPTNYLRLSFIGDIHSLPGHLFEANCDSRPFAREITNDLSSPCPTMVARGETFGRTTPSRQSL
jgi:hypothetical protein